MTATPRVVEVEVVSDTHCPWCWVGKRNLEEAAKSLDPSKAKLNVSWTPYQLNPTMPEKSTSKKAYYLEKFGPRLPALEERLSEAARKVGIDIIIDGKVGNSLQSHRLADWSKKFGLEKHNEVMDKLFEAYLKENRDISDKAVLVEVAKEAGLEGAKEFLGSDELTDEVKREAQRSRSRNVNGVPYFVVDGKYKVSGAQPPEYFLQLFEHLELIDE